MAKVTCGKLAIYRAIDMLFYNLYLPLALSTSLTHLGLTRRAYRHQDMCPGVPFNVCKGIEALVSL